MTPKRLSDKAMSAPLALPARHRIILMTTAAPSTRPIRALQPAMAAAILLDKNIEIGGG
jgi:hypothetical protein